MECINWQNMWAQSCVVSESGCFGMFSCLGYQGAFVGKVVHFRHVCVDVHASGIFHEMAQWLTPKHYRCEL